MPAREGFTMKAKPSYEGKPSLVEAKPMHMRIAQVFSHAAEIGVFLAAAAALTVGMLGLR
jgi:hypothetical protein